MRMARSRSFSFSFARARLYVIDYSQRGYHPCRVLLLAQAGAHACAIARVSLPVKLQWPTARCLQPYDDMYAATPSNDAELNEAANPFDYFISANLPHRHRSFAWFRYGSIYRHDIDLSLWLSRLLIRANRYRAIQSHLITIFVSSCVYNKWRKFELYNPPARTFFCYIRARTIMRLHRTDWRARKYTQAIRFYSLIYIIVYSNDRKFYEMRLMSIYDSCERYMPRVPVIWIKLIIIDIIIKIILNALD